LFLRLYIPSFYRKKASIYVFWFTKKYFEPYLLPISKFPRIKQIKFRFLRKKKVFRWVSHKGKKKTKGKKVKKKRSFSYSFFSFRRRRAFKLLYIKANLFFKQKLLLINSNKKSIKYKHSKKRKKDYNFKFQSQKFFVGRGVKKDGFFKNRIRHNKYKSKSWFKKKKQKANIKKFFWSK